MKNRHVYRKFIPAFLLLSLLFGISASFAEDAWMPEFQDICGRTQEADAMSKDELKALLARCEKLKPIIEKSENPQKNVYLFRLEKCRKLFAYMLEASGKM